MGIEEVLGDETGRVKSGLGGGTSLNLRKQLVFESF